MSQTNSKNLALEDQKVPTKIKLSALWVTLVLSFVYGDLTGLYRIDAIKDIINGKIFVFDITQQFLLIISIYVLIPIVMVFLSLVIKPKISRTLSIVFGIFYALTSIGTVIGDEYAYYVLFMFFNLLVAGTIVRTAWKWPKQ